MKAIGIVLTGLGVALLFWLTWRDGMAAPAGYPFGMPGPAEEASYCLAVSERIREITGEAADRRLEQHLDEQIAFWRDRAGSALGVGRAALARDSAAPGANEGAVLHLAIQDCALRAISFYGHRFPSME